MSEVWSQGLVIGLLLVLASQLGGEVEGQQRLQHIDKQINRVEGRVREGEQRIDYLHSEHSRLEQRMEQIHASQREQRQRQRMIQRELNSLQLESERLHSRQSTMFAELEDMVYMAYRQIVQPRVHLIVSGRSDSNLARHYFDWLEREHVRKLQAYRDLQRELHSHEEVVRARNRAVDRTAAELAQAARELDSLRQQHTVALSKLRRQRSSDQQRLVELRREYQALRILVEELTSASVEVNNSPFSRLRGRLPRPFEGQLRHRFGSPRAGDLRWNEQVMAGAEGTGLRAVADGTVVYAGLLKPVGNFVLVNHGEGYLTIYGGGVIQVSEQDSVQAGQVLILASSGVEGKESQVYFGIRHNTRPLDPDEWLAERW